MAMQKFEVFRVAYASGEKKGPYRTLSQALKFVLPKLQDPRSGAPLKDPNDLNKPAWAVVQKHVEEMEPEDGQKKNFAPAAADSKLGPTGPSDRYTVKSDGDGNGGPIPCSLVKDPKSGAGTAAIPPK